MVVHTAPCPLGVGLLAQYLWGVESPMLVELLLLLLLLLIVAAAAAVAVAVVYLQVRAWRACGGEPHGISVVSMRLRKKTRAG